MLLLAHKFIRDSLTDKVILLSFLCVTILLDALWEQINEMTVQIDAI